MSFKIELRDMINEDCESISNAFKQQGWNKSIELYKEYYDEMKKGDRNVIIAEYDGVFAGYLTIKWESTYNYFRENNIPEIKDLNVLIKYRRNGIASKLMEEVETRIFKISKYAGLGVGLYPDYGHAQKLYVKRGYIPDGRGICYEDKTLEYGEKVVLDDDLCLMFVKERK